MRYHQLKDAISKLPSSMLPGIFIHVVKCALRAKVFREDGMENIIAREKEIFKNESKMSLHVDDPLKDE